MKKWIGLFFGLFLILWPTEVLGQVIELQSGTIEKRDVTTKTKALTDVPVELTPLQPTYTFTYHLRSEITKGQNELVLSTEHSDLLIAPSALTIEVDQMNIQTIALNDSTPPSIHVPLPQEALTPGEHQVTLKFDGIVKEGVCVDQHVYGNWLQLNIQSHLRLHDIEQETTISLGAYREHYRGTKENPTYIIVPSQATDEEKTAAFRIGAYLIGESNETAGVQVITEEKITQFSKQTILLGVPEHFETAAIKEVIESAPKMKEDTMYIGQRTLKKGQEQVQTLIVLAPDEATLEKKSLFLTDDRYVEQMAKEEMWIDTLPPLTRDRLPQKVSLQRLNIAPIMLDGQTSKSVPYVFHLPTEADRNQTLTLELTLRQSDILRLQKEEETYSSDTELIVFVNDYPHPIDLMALEENDFGEYVTTLTIEPSIIRQDGVIAFQFEANGLYEKVSCVDHNERRWVWIDPEKSTWTFQVGENAPMKRSFAMFPYLWIDEKKPTYIVTSTGLNAEMIQPLFVAISSRWQLNEVYVRSPKGDVETIKKGNVITWGQEALDFVKTKNEPLPDWEAHGFVTSTLHQRAALLTEEENVWMHLYEADVTKEDVSRFVQALTNLKKDATLAAETSYARFFTNAVELSNESVEPLPEEKVTVWPWMVGIVVLLSIGILLLYMTKKRRRRSLEDLK